MKHMKNTYNHMIKKIGFLSMIMALLFTACTEEESPYGPKTQAPSIGEIALDTENLSTLVAALVQADGDEPAGLVKAVTNGKGPFTVFAPTNQAFQEFLANFDGYDTLEDFDSAEKRAILKEVLQYHIINSVEALSTDLTQGQEITTRQGETVVINISGGIAIQDKTGESANVVAPDIQTRNGVVHMIDKVLLPDAVINGVRQDLVDLVIATESLSNLEAAVIKTGLVDTLRSTGPFTVFAPTDDAFVALLNLMGDDYNSIDDFDTEAEINLLRDILLYHVIPAEVLSPSLTEGPVSTALADNAINVIPSGDSFVIGDATQAVANITGADILALNGVAHTINKVLLPQSAVDFVTSITLKNVFETLASQNQYSLLTDALAHVEDGLVELLSGEGSFTIFAPTNDAIRTFFGTIPDCGALSDFDTDAEKAFLATVLKYHVFVPATQAGEFANGEEITTAQGETFSVNVGDGVSIDDATLIDANVTQADIIATNGVIHRIDKVLQAPEIAAQLGTSE